MVLLLTAVTSAPAAEAQDLEGAADKMSRRAVFDQAAKMELHVEHDRFTGAVVVAVVGPTPILARSEAGDVLMFEPEYVLLGSGRSGYVVQVTAAFREWAFMRGTIEFLADGRPTGETASGTPQRDTRSSGGVIEQFTAWIAPTLFDRLSRANRIEVRLSGERKSFTYVLAPRFVAIFWKLREAPQALKGG
jgi:hypothetical protein